MVVGCVATLLVAAAPAAAVNLTPSQNPLPGSTFQAADGDQTPAPPLTDWETRQAAGEVVHAPDPNDADSAFKGGSKEDKPGDWDLTTEKGGVNPAKDNIRDAWASVDQPGGRTFAYLAYAREKENGTTFVTFELNRDSRVWNNGRAQIPCRRTGDVLISFEPQGNRASVVVSRWKTTATDAGTGCATKGSLTDATGLADGVDVQGAANTTDIPNSLPGAYGATIPKGRFGETGIDLAAVLEDAFGDRCMAYTSVWMHSRSSTSESSNMQDYVAPRPLDARTCAAAGTKFFDRDANGVRDPGEPGLARFEIFADYDGDGELDASEPYTVTDRRGRYVLDDIRPPGGSYTLRERLLRRTPRDWRCSHPGPVGPGPLGCGWGPIDVATEPYARDRDFGNWFPARLTVRKELYPPDDPGRFDLLVNGAVVLPSAGDGASLSLRVDPGNYTVNESAVPPTDPGAYTSATECKRGPRRRERTLGTSFGPFTLLAGGRITCTFRNLNTSGPEPVPAVAIDKTGPLTAQAGSTLEYRLFVENVGEVPFPAGTVDVTDPHCDEAPELAGKSDAAGDPDASPGTLDPGDTWEYRCSRGTPEPSVNCDVHVVSNTGTVAVTVDGDTLEDSSTIDTLLGCPPPPLEPAVPVEPGPPPSPVTPPGPTPPGAGVAGAVSLSPLRSCLRRGSVATIRGERISRVALFVGGRRIRGLSIRPLRHQVKIRLTRSFRPGRYRVTARIHFQRGSGTPPLVLVRRVRVCAPPRFTG